MNCCSQNFSDSGLLDCEYCSQLLCCSQIKAVKTMHGITSLFPSAEQVWVACRCKDGNRYTQHIVARFVQPHAGTRIPNVLRSAVRHSALCYCCAFHAWQHGWLVDVLHCVIVLLNVFAGVTCTLRTFLALQESLAVLVQPQLCHHHL